MTVSQGEEGSQGSKDEVENLLRPKTHHMTQLLLLLSPVHVLLARYYSHPCLTDEQTEAQETCHRIVSLVEGGWLTEELALKFKHKESL